MEAESIYETSVNFYQTTRSSNPKDRTPYSCLPPWDPIISPRSFLGFFQWSCFICEPVLFFPILKLGHRWVTLEPHLDTLTCPVQTRLSFSFLQNIRHFFRSSLHRNFRRLSLIFTTLYLTILSCSICSPSTCNPALPLRTSLIPHCFSNPFLSVLPRLSSFHTKVRSFHAVSDGGWVANHFQRVALWLPLCFRVHRPSRAFV
jgi:hypothetical protein